MSKELIFTFVLLGFARSAYFGITNRIEIIAVLKRKYYKYRYGKHPEKRSNLSEIIGYSIAFVIAMGIGYFNFFIRNDVLWISRKTAGIIWFLIGMIGLLIYGAVIWSEGKYLLIDDEKVTWKPGLFQKRKEVLLETIERAEIHESVITLFIEDRTQFEIDKTKIISTKKKKELDRVIAGLF